MTDVTHSSLRRPTLSNRPAVTARGLEGWRQDRCSCIEVSRPRGTDGTDVVGVVSKEQWPSHRRRGVGKEASDKLQDCSCRLLTTCLLSEGPSEGSCRRPSGATRVSRKAK